MTMTGAPPLLSLDLPAVHGSSAVARRGVRNALGDQVHPDATDTTVLLVSELVTNAHAHAGTPAQLRLWLAALIRVEVQDGSTVVPAMPDVDPSRTSGRGLRIVDALADSWGVTPLPTGKHIWFELPTGPADVRLAMFPTGRSFLG